MTTDKLHDELREARVRFLTLVEHIRPDLHRYCSRMTGSVVDGEDVVQDALARAFFELGELREMPALRSWLFRITHNCAIDFIRARTVRATEPLELAADIADEHHSPELDVVQADSVRIAIAQFASLPPRQRSCVILKDVLGDSLEDISALLELTIPAVKSAIHRGRTKLRELAAHCEEQPIRPVPSPLLAQYAELFNRRDWDGVRKLLVEDVRIEFVARGVREGQSRIQPYFTHYANAVGWRFVPALLEGREVLAVFDGDPAPAYFVDIHVVDGVIVEVRDYRHVRYVADNASFVLR